ncbi:MAG: hypothetical protein FJ102_23050 [Deltaproteobacteria bacterium]|nr:hypothetical protein [Deltaproteobacteria bacterium]
MRHVRRSHLFTIAVVVAAAAIASPRGAAQSTPASPDGVPGAPAGAGLGTGGVTCGFVETTWSDPDWVLATSDYILRSTDCVAECEVSPFSWFDQVEAAPCYSTRFWKLEEDSTIGNAFPMSALGVGTFDGLFVRSKVHFQLYSGVDNSQPFGPEQSGPKYVSIDHWGAVACDSFEPGTFFVTGGPGALANYSISIGDEVTIEELDVDHDDVEKDLHASDYDADFVIRRGASFELSLVVSDAYGSGCHQVVFEAKHTFDGAEKTITMLAGKAAVPPGIWGARIVDEVDDGATKTLEIELAVPGNASLGRYEFDVLVRQAGALEPDDEEEFPEEVVVIANPWSTADQVYLEGESRRNEYVLNESGVMWQGNHPSATAKSWSYAQFDSGGVALRVALDLLSGLSSEQRADAVLVARRLSAQVNSNQGGVLQGNWSGNYAGGTNPSSWSGSLPILSAYDGGGGAVKFGQCWVFGGVLTTTLRTLGIPARPLSNFSSAHDTGADKTIDRYYAADGTFLKALSQDSIWNYHVWCDAWIDGRWNAVDATPQELSGGLHQLGPAPVPAVKAKSGGLYDVDFVTTEVDGDVRYLKDDGTGNYVVFNTDTKAVGLTILTKAIGSSAAETITGAYKTDTSLTGDAAEGAQYVEATVSDVALALALPAVVLLGRDVPMVLELVNSGAAPRTVHTVWSANAVDYHGLLISALPASLDHVTSLAPGEAATVTFTIPEAVYTTVTGDTRVLETALLLQVQETSEAWAHVDTTLLVDGSSLAASMAPEVLAIAGTTTLDVSFTNPLSVPLTNARFVFQLDAGLSTAESEVSLGNVDPGEAVTIPVEVTGTAEGVHGASVLLDSEELSDVTVFAQAAVLVDGGLSAEVVFVSAAAGGTQTLHLDAGPAHAGRSYLILGSASGSSPGTKVGAVTVPLAFDAYTAFTADSANSTALVNTHGQLDALGQAEAQIVVPAGLPPSVAGMTLHHAYVLYGPIDFASNTVPLVLE